MCPAASALLPVHGLLIFSYYCIAPGERQDPTRSKETAKLCVLSVWYKKRKQLRIDVHCSVQHFAKLKVRFPSYTKVFFCAGRRSVEELNENLFHFISKFQYLHT
jgi:hypothetical protein